MTLRQMLPGFSGNNFLDKRDGNTELHRNLGLLNVFAGQLPYLLDLRFVQLRAWVGRAILTRLAILLVSVIHIVLMSAKKEMGGIHARSMIAGVANFHAFGYGAKVYLPRYALRVSGHAVNDQAAIPPRCKAGCPIPAFIWVTHINLFPEFFFDGFLRLKSRRMTFQEAHRLSFDAPPTWISIFSYIGWLTTTAFTKFGSLRGIIGVHRKPLLSVSNPGTLARCRPVFLLVRTPVIIPQEAAL